MVSISSSYESIALASPSDEKEYHSQSSRQRFTVPLDCGGQRLDLVLSQLTGKTRSQVKLLLDEKKVWVDGVCRKASYLVRSGEILEGFFSRTDLTLVKPQEIPLDLIYEDKYLAAINKPPGMVVHPAPGQWEGTVVNALLFYWGWNGSSDLCRPGIVHRLDKDTSGVLLVAKNQQTLEQLSCAFKERNVHKQYIAVVNGYLRSQSGTIELPIGRHPINRKKMAIRAQGGRVAVSHYRVLAEEKSMSVVQLFPETGRTHQLRVHLAAIGHPVIGDKIYGGSEYLKSTDPLVRLFPRQALHAEEIRLLHPITETVLQIRAPYPADLLALLNVFPELSKSHEKFASC